VERHDVDDESFEKALEKLKPQIKNEYQFKDVILTLAKAHVLMKLLASIREYAEYDFWDCLPKKYLAKGI